MRKPTMNRYLPCCMSPTPNLRRKPPYCHGAARRTGRNRKPRRGSRSLCPQRLLVLVVLDRVVLGRAVRELLALLDGFGGRHAAGHHLAERARADLLLLESHV